MEPQTTMDAFSAKRIEQARQTLGDAVRHTPLVYSKTLSDLTGGTVYLKLENLQHTGSFKLRGAFNKIQRLTPDERSRGVVCASAGNHAQGIAFSATTLGVRSTIFMPIFASPSKIQATRAYGAHVELTGTIFDDAYDAAQAYAREHGAVFVPAFDDYDIIAGQGTLGLEIVQDLETVDVVLCPVGGGGLLAGVAAALKHRKPEVVVVGVGTEGAQAMNLSVQQGRIVPMPGLSTIADGIAIKRPGEKTFPLVQQHVDRLATVSDEETANAVFLLMQHAKVVAEPAGAVGLAALLADKAAFADKNVVVILSGGNIDLGLLAQVVERGLYVEGLRATLAIDVPDRPGNLDMLVGILADLRANIQSISHDRYTTSVPVGHVRVTITFRTLGREQVATVEDALRARGLHYQVLT